MKRAKSNLLAIHPKALLRTPQFPLDAELRVSWQRLKISISYAAPGFYNLIKEMNYEDLLAASDAIGYTVWKYFNRAKYRATPFGSFAGIGLLNICSSNDKDIILESEQQLHVFQDWPETVEADLLTKDIKNLKFFTNHSCYIFQNSIRYLSHFDDKHQLSEVESDPVILKLLKRCTTPVSYDVIVDILINSICAESIEGLIRDMVAIQLLFTSDRPHVISTSQFKKMNLVSAPAHRSYIIAERKVSAGTVHPSKFSHLPELVQILNGILKPETSPQLTEFISRFRQKFGEQWIPIMRALDPEIGLGYGNLEQFDIEDSPFPSLKTRPLPKDLWKLKTRLLNFLSASQLQGISVISLEDLDLEPHSKPATLPNSLTVVAQLSGELMHVQSIGGSTTNAVLGRFSLCGDAYLNHCREIKDLEQHANPDVLFFDIGYLAEKGAANINRRASIYDLELNLLNNGTSTDQLTIDDLFLGVQGNELILYSRKLAKRLVPRMASAYNYNRSDLAVFRLLCDLQHQGIQTDLNLNLRDLYPDLSYYPRLMFESIIISPAAWKIDIKGVTDINLILENLKKLGVPRLFTAGETDQTLCFDQCREEDMQAFAQYLYKHKVFYVQEAWNDGFARDSSGHSYQNQLVLSLTHNNKIYHRNDLDFPVGDLFKTQTCFLPGSKWLYFQIFCHPFRTEALLLNSIGPFLAEFRPVIKKWFFIRYDENGPHIRLRVCLKDPGLAMQLTAELSALLGVYLESGMVSEFLISTYKPEVERYGSDLIEQVEVHFCRDSELIIGLLSTPLNTFEKYRLCESIFQKIECSGIFGLKEFEHLTQAICDSFALEFSVRPPDFKLLNETYQKFLKVNPPSLTEVQKEAFDLYCSSLLELLKSCNIERRGKLFSDLIHMHVNRLFLNAQRRHELSIYYFMSKTLKSTQFMVLQ